MPKSRKKVKAKPNSPRQLPRLILGLILLCGFALIALVFFNPWVGRLNLRAELEKDKLATTVYDRNGEVIASLYSKARIWVPISQIPPALQQAFVATEDSRFYEHKGIDAKGVLRALYQNILQGRKVQGGSTITQQLVKNLYFSQEKTWIRKVLEMAYAVRIEQQYSKAQILENYLNIIYLGHGAWGVDSAAHVYFGKRVQDLSVAESALIAALARSPEYYSPFRRPQAAVERRNLVLQLMKEHGYLPPALVNNLTKQSLQILRAPGSTFVGSYFVDYIFGILKEKTGFSETYLRAGGFRIYTTMDRQAQSAAEEAVQLLPEEGPDRWGVIQPQAAMVALNPKTGELLSMVGGRRYSAGEPNRAFQFLRQPGSAIKPFVYATAIENGYHPETRMNDQPLEIDVNGTIWRPQNYDGKYRGNISLREALEESVNTIAVQLVQELGPERVFTVAREMGLTNLVGTGASNDKSLAPLALGGLTKGVSLLELTSAYSSFANNGIHSNPWGIFRVYSRDGKLIYQEKAGQRGVIQPQTARILTAMMEGVITRGTGIQANIGIRGAAGKTGTSSNNTNGWFIGYTSDILAGVWIGNDQSSKALAVKGVALGSGMAAAIWGRFLGQFLARPAEAPPNSPRQ